MLIAENNAKSASLDSDKADFDKQVDEILSQLQQEAKSVIDKANETAKLIISDAKRKAEEAGSISSVQSRTSSYSAPKKQEYNEKIDSHRSKMDSFFAAISRTLRGEGK